MSSSLPVSGGMDTGSISAVASKIIESMHTFTCGFELPENASDLEKYFDESENSHELARLMGTIHHELTLGSEAMPAAVNKVVWHLDEPRVGISYQFYRKLNSTIFFYTIKKGFSHTIKKQFLKQYEWRVFPHYKRYLS